jgi:transglutaminase-like putative cysteine protease
MRIHVSHLTSYRYGSPATGAIQTLRLTPRNHEGQYVARWRIDVSSDCRLDQHEDAFGNVTHTFTTDGPLDTLEVLAEGEVETRDTQGIVRGTIERFPPALYLRETLLTKPDDRIAALGAECRTACAGDVLKLLHCLMGRLHGEITLDLDPRHAAITAAEALALGRGVSQDVTHIFIAAARCVEVPARYVGGYFHRTHDDDDQGAGHAWAEAFVPGLGWVAFDPANGLCGTDAHVRVAVGLDHLGAMPLRGSRYGGAGETRAVRVRVAQDQQQSQS